MAQDLLSPAEKWDDDASLRSHSEVDTDSDDDQLTRDLSSHEVARHDRTVLAEEEEREKLIVQPRSAIGRFFASFGNSSTAKVNKRRMRRRRNAPEERRLMYEVEDGFESTSDVSEPDTAQWSFCACSLIHVLMLLMFVAIVWVAYSLSGRWRERDRTKTLLISLDGFRADFLEMGLTPTLNAFVAEGVSPKYMLPSFPSVTFPNHWTIATGLYPESHGIVGNTFWDPTMKEEFYYTQREHSMQPKWWGGEPIWVTAEKADISTGIHMWPGSEAHIGHPDILDKYDGKEGLDHKADRVIELVSKAQFVAAYVPNVDTDGHNYGPNSTEVRKTLQEVDAMLGRIFSTIGKDVNVIIVSDHGMATTSNERLIQLDNFIDLTLVEHTDGWPLYGLRPHDLGNLESMYRTLKAHEHPGFDVYLRDLDMPERWHFSKNARIAPLWIVPKTGWAIVTKAEFDVEEAKTSGAIYSPRGVHGYDNVHPLMRAIFVARGPSFPHAPNSRIEPFQNIEVYNILCDALGITPKPNNGTLRLPFKPIGLHETSSVSSAAVMSSTQAAKSTEMATPSMSTSGVAFSEATSASATHSSQSATSSAAKPTKSTAPSSFWDDMLKEIDEWVDWTLAGFPSSKNEGSS